MKKSLLAIGLTALLFGACKKEEIEEFLATDMTGTSVISGKITNDIRSQNAGSGYQTIMVPSAGIVVQARVWNDDLYPNSPNAQGSEVYSATTDANGNYSISVKTNGDGVQAYITIANRVGTFDTIVNGVTKTGPTVNFYGTNTNVWVYKGSPATYNYNMWASSPIVGNPMPVTIGTAVISGTIQVLQMEEDTFTGPIYYYNASAYMPVANHSVRLDFNVDPLTMLRKTYTTTTNASGVYSFTVTTSDDPGFNPYGYLRLNDYVATRDTLRVNKTTVSTGISGVFDGNCSTCFFIGGIDPNEVINHQNYTYTNFH